MNIVAIIQAALTALNSDAEVLLLEQARAENEELNHTKDTIIVYPDWRTSNILNPGAELIKERDYNIIFKAKDEWDNSDNSNPNYNITSIGHVESMNKLAYSILSYIILNKELIQVTKNPTWQHKPILRAGNGTMSGIKTQLKMFFSSDLICPTISIQENDTTNIKSIIESIVVALNYSATVYTLEQARAANRELEFDDTVIIINPNWTVRSEFSEAGEIFQRYLYNIDFKTQDEWDNSDNQNDNSYNGITSIEKIEAMETLSDSIFSYMTVKRDLFPKLKNDPNWNTGNIILRAGNGTMSGVSVRLDISIYGDRVCDYSGFSEQFKAVYDTWVSKPNLQIASNMDAMVRGWVSSGVWDKSDRIFVFAIHTNDNGEALIDWKNPAGTAATMVNNPTFTPFEGFEGDGATKYINSNYNPAVDGINLTVNDGNFSIGTRKEVITRGDYGVLDGINGLYIIEFLSPGIYIRYGDSSRGKTHAGTTGYYGVNRIDSSIIQYFINDDITNTTSTITNLPNLPLYLLARNQNGSAVALSENQILFASMGASLTQQELIDRNKYIEAYMDSNGKGVI